MWSMKVASKCKLKDCVEVCPVDCFYGGENPGAAGLAAGRRTPGLLRSTVDACDLHMLVIHDLAESAGDAVEDNDRAGTARIGGLQQVTKR